MIWWISKRKNTVILFGVGFLIGVIFKIALVERGRLAALLYNILTYSSRHDLGVACVVYLKRDRSETLEASENTWLKKCDESYVFRVERDGRRARDSPAGTGSDGVCERTGITNVTAKSAWGGLCKSLLSIRSSKCQWFIFSPENLLVLVDNLKMFVKDFDWEEEHYYGHAVGHFEADFNVFSAGILISRGTLARLIEKFRTEEECEAGGKYWRNEDLYLGKHLKKMGILPKDTRDVDGRGRFHGYNIDVLLSPGKLFRQSDYTRKALFPVRMGLNCCSPYLITIDATNSQRMYHHYYYIYKLDKTNKATKTYAPAKSDGFDWKEFLREEGYDDSAIENMTAEEYYQIWAKKVPPESLYEMMREQFGS